MHQNSLKSMTYFRDRYIALGDYILDVGSLNVNGTYRSLFKKQVYIGMDIIAGSNVDIVGYENIKKTYDAVVSGQVMEHVKRPWDWLKNLTQYTHGLICIIAPNTWGEHRYPLDTYRYFPDGMRDLFEYAGIHELEIFKSFNDTIGIGDVK